MSVKLERIYVGKKRNIISSFQSHRGRCGLIVGGGEKRCQKPKESQIKTTPFNLSPKTRAVDRKNISNFILTAGLHHFSPHSSVPQNCVARYYDQLHSAEIGRNSFLFDVHLIRFPLFGKFNLGQLRN